MELINYENLRASVAEELDWYKSGLVFDETAEDWECDWMIPGETGTMSRRGYLTKAVARVSADGVCKGVTLYGSEYSPVCDNADDIDITDEIINYLANTYMEPDDYEALIDKIAGVLHVEACHGAIII